MSEQPTPEPRPRYRITVEALPGWLAPPLKRIGRLMKIAGRRFGLRCLGVENVPSSEDKPVKR